MTNYQEELYKEPVVNMPALTVRNSRPGAGEFRRRDYATMIAEGVKTIETRTWKTKHRGPLLICTNKDAPARPRGCAIAVCRLTGCRRMEGADWKAACCECYPNAWGFLLADVHPIEPFSVIGRLGIYRVPVPLSRARQILALVGATP